MIPSWKVRREARRVREQVKALIMQPIYWKHQHDFDRNLDTHIKIETGALSLCNNIVVLLVYQPKGISASVFHTLSHLKSEGFSAFVVLNFSVEDSEYEKLKESCALIMRRPNFGYDFGGYRDAILHLLKIEHSLNSITCINDSIWFPVYSTCDHLRRMLKISGDFVGYSLSKGVKRKKNIHIQSYLFMFKGIDFLKSESFKSYWSDLKISNSRHFTIRNSEMKMMRYFEDRKFKIGCLFSADDMKAYYKSCSDEKITAAVHYLNAIGHHSAALFKDVPAEDITTIRQTLISGIESGKLSRNVIGSEPDMLFKGIGFAAMKKSKSYNYQIQRNIAVKKGICSDFDATVSNEVRALNGEFVRDTEV